MMELFEMVNSEGSQITVSTTVDSRVCILIDEESQGATFNWQKIFLTEDEAKAVRRALMTAISYNKLRKDEE